MPYDKKLIQGNYCYWASF